MLSRATCAHCEDLEAEVAYLKRELGLAADFSVTVALRDAMPPSKAGGNGGRRQAAQFVAALYNAKGRAVSRWNLLEAVPSPTMRDRDDSIVAVWAAVSRRTFGKDAIATVWGQGYRLTEEGMARVQAILTAKALAA